MKTRVLIAALIIIVTLIAILMAPLPLDGRVVMDGHVIESGEWSYELFIYYGFALLGLASIVFAVVSDYKGNDKKYVSALFAGGILLTLGTLIMDIAFIDNREPWLYLTFLCGIFAIATSIATKENELKIAFAVASASVMLITIMFLPLYINLTIIAEESNIVITGGDTIYDLLFRFEEINTISILFAISAVTGLSVAIISIVSYSFGKDEYFESGIISSGIFSVIATMLFLVNVNFEFNALNSVGYLLFLSGVANIVTGILARSERI